MARSISEIKAQIINAIAGNSDLQGLDSSSGFGIYGLFAYIVSVAINQLEKLFDVHVTEVDKAIYENKPGTARWYRNMSLAFQYGFNLLTDDDQFDNTGFTTDQIEASKIIKYCSVKESLESSRLIIKIAGENNGNLIPLIGNEIDAFYDYISEVSYAGVKINVVNNPADRLALTLRVYRNPLVIDENGNNIVLGGKPIETAIKQYMKNLPFDGELVINDMIDYLRDVPGVENVHVLSAQSSYKDLVTGLFTPFINIDVKTIPVAGYFETGTIVSGAFVANNFTGISYVV